MSQIYSNFEDREPGSFIDPADSSHWELKVSHQHTFFTIFNTRAGESSAGHTPWTTTLSLSPTRHDGVGHLHHVTGTLFDIHDEINLKILRACIRLGYHKVFFERPQGLKGSRWGVYESTSEGKDFYIIDLTNPELLQAIEAMRLRTHETK